MSNEKTGASDDTRITDLDASVRLCNILLREGCSTLGDIRKADWDKLKFAKSMGRNTWREFYAFAVTYGLSKPKAKPEELAQQDLLDHFAGLAMQAQVTGSEVGISMGKDYTELTCFEDMELVAAASYALAAAMIAERKRIMEQP